MVFSYAQEVSLDIKELELAGCTCSVYGTSDDPPHLIAYVDNGNSRFCRIYYWTDYPVYLVRCRDLLVPTRAVDRPYSSFEEAWGQFKSWALAGRGEDVR